MFRYLLGNNICGGVSCHWHVWTLANITIGPGHNVQDTCSSVRATLVVMLVYICALLMTPLHYSSHARCPCNVTLWFLGIYVSALVWLGCGSHPWPTAWAMLSRIGCHGTFHITSNLPSSIQWLKCRWYIRKKNGTSNQEHASGPEMMSHEGDHWVGSHLPPTVRNQVWLVFAAILFRSGQSAANWNRNLLNYRVKVIVIVERGGFKLGISKVIGPVSLGLQPRQLTAACPAKHSVNPN